MVVTRWYRAPELFMGETTYGAEVDMWSVGWVKSQLEFLSSNHGIDALAPQMYLRRNVVEASSIAGPKRPRAIAHDLRALWNAGQGLRKILGCLTA